MSKQKAETVHPFFKQKGEQDVPTESIPQANIDGIPTKPKRGRPTKKQQEQDVLKREEHAQDVANPIGTTVPVLSKSLEPKSAKTADIPLVEVNGSFGQKRRRLSPPEKHDGTWFKQLQTAAAGKARKKNPEIQPIPPNSIAHTLKTITNSPDYTTAKDNETQGLTKHLDTTLTGISLPLAPAGNTTPSPRKSTKTLKLNGAGGLGTPSERKARNSKKYVVEDETSKSPRPKRRRKQPGRTTLVLNYGIQDDELRISTGQKIDAILASPPNILAPKNPSPTKKSAVNPLKPSHPFFSEKAPSNSRTNRTRDVEPEKAVKPRPAMSFSTPGKLDAMRRGAAMVTHAEDNSKPEPRKDMIYKVPGTVDPAWPPMFSHRVEPASPHNLPQVHRGRLHALYHKNRRKAKATYINPEESVLNNFSRSLMATGNSDVHAPRLTLPRRAVMSGSALKEHVLRAITSSSDVESACQHPLLTRLLNTISNSQSAFDRGQCETQAWSQKYAPRTSAEILQPEKEVRILREWLQLQTVNSTRVSGIGTSAEGRLYDTKFKKRKKRRKISDELDDFVVDGEDEGMLLKDLSDDEGSVASLGPAMRSLVQDGQLSSSNTALIQKANAVLISGPTGCGKTSAVYALAKELDFEVFDIGPNTQRSGRDILDKVGNMAQYHQVLRSKEATKPEAADEESVTEDVDTTLPAERSQDQSSLKSFFTQPKKSHSKPKQARSVAAEKPMVKTVAKLQGKLTEHKRSSARQTQSLILLEEVDVLFEQDKQFWETVLELAAQSRRPIIMTCNDESLIPVKDLQLHALLRFRMPPMFLSTHYLMLVAAAEGHLIDPSELEFLLQVKQHDLRAGISELSFWCQMALGDQKGGLEWYLSQWPAGTDIGPDGQKLRVVSKGTYRKELGFLENMKSNEDALEDERQLREAWEHWSVDPMDLLLEAMEQRPPRTTSTYGQSTNKQNLPALRDRHKWSDLMSATDNFCRIGLPGSEDMRSGPVLDPTQPPIPLTVRADHIEGRTLLYTPELIDYQSLDTQMMVYVNFEATKHFTSNDSKLDLDVGTAHLRDQLLQHHKSRKSPQWQTIEQSSNSLVKSLMPLADPTTGLETRAVLATETAPYVRAIARFDLSLERHRADLVAPGQKSRKTRASRSALEGGQRSQTRRERWFGPKVDLTNILTTAGIDWAGSTILMSAISATSRSASSREGSVDELA